VLLISRGRIRIGRGNARESISYFRARTRFRPRLCIIISDTASPAAKRFVRSARVLGEELTRRHEINDRPRLKVLHRAQFAPRFPSRSRLVTRLLGRATGDHFELVLQNLLRLRNCGSRQNKRCLSVSLSLSLSCSHVTDESIGRNVSRDTIDMAICPSASNGI